MEYLIVGIVIIVFVILNSLPFIVGVLNTPSGSVFLGTVHWPGDYYYYLSQFAQGRNSWFTSYNLYTNDFPQKTFVGWVNVFLGHIFSLAGIDHLAAYQLSIVIFTITFLFVSYLLIREIYSVHVMGPADASAKSLTAFILFVTSNAFPGYDYWFNNGVPFNRLGGVPHHLIARTAIVLTLLLAIRWWKKTNIKDKISKIKYVFGFFLMGFVLASVEPVHWILTAAILFLIPFVNFSVITFSQYFLHNIKYQRSKIKQPFFPSILLFLGGLPMAIYIKRLFANPPYLQLAVWEASQQVDISIWNFILANGPVMVLAIVGLFLMFYYQTGPADSSPPTRVTRFLVLVFPLLTIGLFFSPIPRWVGIVNVRFLPAVTTLFLAVLATEGISILARVPSQTLRSARQFSGTSPRLFLIFITLFIMLPSYYVQIQNRIKTEPANAFFYITQNAYESYKEAEKISGQNDTFLVIWPFNWSFPGITGRRVYEGHTLLTSDYNNKELMTRSFFFGDMSTTDMEKMLRVNRIDYVMTYPWMQKINELPNLIKVYDNGMLGVYRVTE